MRGVLRTANGEVEGRSRGRGILGVVVVLVVWALVQRRSRFGDAGVGSVRAVGPFGSKTALVRRTPKSVRALPAAGASPWRTLAVMADALAPSVGIGAAMVRLGCFLSGCCFGVRSELPWALRFPAHSPPWEPHLQAGWIGPGWPESLSVHPLQLYFILLSLLAAALAF